MKLLPFSIAVAGLAVMTSEVQAQTSASSTCYEMTASPGSIPFSGGSGPGFKWRLLGGCEVTLQPDGTPSAFWMTNTKQTIPVSSFTWLKPYQNPTGMTLAGSWANSAGTRAIFAIKTW